jgi:hypothetical protein
LRVRQALRAFANLSCGSASVISGCCATNRLTSQPQKAHTRTHDLSGLYGVAIKEQRPRFTIMKMKHPTATAPP